MVDRFNFSQDAPGHFDRIGVGLFANTDTQTAIAVDAHNARQLFVGVFDFGDLPQGGEVLIVEDIAFFHSD